MYLKLDPIDVIVNKIFEKREDTYMEIDAGKKYGIYEIPFDNQTLLPIKEGDKLTAMIGSHGIPDFIGDKYCEKNICTHCMYVYSVWDKYGRKLYHDE